MNLPAKMLAARKALKARQQESDEITEVVTPKMQAAREELIRLQRRAVPLGPTGNTIADEKPPHCKVQLDRTDVGCRGIDMNGLLTIPEFKRTNRHWIKKKRPDEFVPYGCVSTFKSRTSKAQFRVYSEPKSRRLPRFKVTFLPEDKVGLEIAMLRPVLDRMDNPVISLVEVAFDFPDGSGVHSPYVRAHGLFGKCDPYLVGIRPGWDAWGTRGSAKFVRSYYKEKVNAHRVELQLQGAFLRPKRIRTERDLLRLVDLLPRHHIWFGRLSEQKLNQAMHKRGFNKNRIQMTIDEVRANSGHLWEVLALLRRKGLKNVKRLLIPVPATGSVRRALKVWTTRWRISMELYEEKP
jgi:hypothetical protein